MTRYQIDDFIPRIMPVFRDGKRVELTFRGGGYGYGLFVFAGQAIVSWLMAHSPRYPLLGTRGYGGAFMWADPNAKYSASTSACRHGLTVKLEL